MAMTNSKNLSRPRLILVETINDDHFCVGDHISLAMVMNVDGILVNGLRSVLSGSAFQDSLVDKIGSKANWHLLKNGEPFNYLGMNSPGQSYNFKKNGTDSWSNVLKDKDLNLLSSTQLQLEGSVQSIKAVKEGAGKVKLAVNPLENRLGGCEHEIVITIHSNAAKETVKRMRVLKKEARDQLKGKTGTAGPSFERAIRSVAGVGVPRKVFKQKVEQFHQRYLEHFEITQAEIDNEIKRLLKDGCDVIPVILRDPE